MTPAPPNAAAGDPFAANLTGALLAVASSAFIGVSFIVKKKGLRRAAAAGARAGARSFSVIGGRKALSFSLFLSVVSPVGCASNYSFHSIFIHPV
jgi:hypothetical protein